jgi:hypothetical protein
MKWSRISTGIELMRVATDEIVYVHADGNYSDFVLTNDKANRRVLTHFDQFYYITTRHKETLWDFVDDLSEYVFIDTIYITGGADYVFCGDKDGVKHNIGDTTDYPHEKWKGIVPWLVYRKNS